MPRPIHGTELFAVDDPRVLWRVEAPHFVAGLLVVEDRIVEAAPIVRWAQRMTFVNFRKYCRGRRWTLEKVEGSR